MTVDYDLVVIGSSLAGIYAARNAVKLQARVALVTQSNDQYLPNNTLFNCNLRAIFQLRNNLNNSFFFDIENSKESLNIEKVISWAKETKTAVENLNSLSNLAALGVDIVIGKGSFCSSPDLNLQVGKRTIVSRRYLLATGSNFVLDFIDNSGVGSYLTFADIANHQWQDLPEKLIIVGSEPIALELAQILSFFGKQVTLVVKETRILPQEDLEISILLQAQLEADGIKILTNAIVSQIKNINHQKWLQAGDYALSADEIILADYRQPNISELNLLAVNVKYNKQRVYVNEKLETTNPRIYACGDLIGGYDLPNIAQYEAQIILKNTLFFSCYKVNYHTIPWAISTQPSLARVGLNERQARQKKADIYIIREYFDCVSEGKILDSNPGICKLLVDQTGEILGCSIFGDRAAELITIPALMMQHNIKLDRNPMRGLTNTSIPNVYPSMVEILERAIENFYQQIIQQNPKLRNRLQSWFSLRKN